MTAGGDRRGRGVTRRGLDRGMTSVELALAIPSVVLVLAMVLLGLTLAVDQLRVTDAARTAARAASRGVDDDEVRRVAADLSPDGSSIEVSVQDGTDGGAVTVTVLAPRRLGLLPGLPQASADASMPREPTDDLP